jgi:hypothetical protein
MPGGFLHDQDIHTPLRRRGHDRENRRNKGAARSSLVEAFTGTGVCEGSERCLKRGKEEEGRKSRESDYFMLCVEPFSYFI